MSAWLLVLCNQLCKYCTLLKSFTYVAKRCEKPTGFICENSNLTIEWFNTAVLQILYWKIISIYGERSRKKSCQNGNLWKFPSEVVFVS